MPSLDPEAIFTAVSQLEIGGTAPFLEEEHHGGQCYVFKLRFADWESLAIRVPILISSNDSAVIIDALRTEWQTLTLLEARGFVWAPKPRACSLTMDNPLKRPFLVLTWAEGHQLSWDEDFPQRPQRDALLGQMAAIQIALIKCTLREGSTTALEFFERIIRNRRTRIQEGKISNVSEQDCDEQQALLPQVLGRFTGDRTIAMDHGDFTPQNIIVDDDYNIKCVIDWGFAGMVPLPRAAGLPRFLWGPVLSPCTRADRQSYVNTFARQEDSSELSYMRFFQTSGDVGFHALYFESLFSKNVHALMATKGWKPHEFE